MVAQAIKQANGQVDFPKTNNPRLYGSGLFV
jgi:hypothetical protein